MYILLSDPQFVYCTKFRFYSVNNQKQNVKARLSNNLCTVLGEYHRQHSIYFEQAAQAAFKTLNHYDQDNNKFYIDIDLYSRTKEVINLQAESSSVGLGYALGCALAMRDQLEKQDTINTIIFTTGEVSNLGNVLKIGYIENKIKGALLAMRDINGASPCKTNTPFIIFYPRSNHDDITAEIKEQVKFACGELVPVEHLQQALKHILGKSYDGSLVQNNRSFKGLSSFDFYDSTLFFGRDKLIEKLLDNFNQGQSLIKVHGVSGCGKSSLVKAGFLPEVCKAYKMLKYAITEPKNHDNNKSLLEYLLIHSDAPLITKEMITEEALSKLICDILVCPKASIAKIKEILPDKKNQLIWYIDQFEQAFFKSKETNLLQVLNELGLAIESLTIIVSIRSEYVQYTGKIGRDYYVEHELSSRSWHSVIHDQALCFGIKFEAELVEHIQEQAKKMSHALPAVEYLLTQMYEYAQRQGYCKTLTFKHYHGLGGLVGVITSQADNAFKACDKRLLNEFFEIFVGINQDKQPYIKRVNLTELEKNNVDLFSLVNALINKQLVIKHLSEQDTAYVKLAHDCLINFPKGEKEQTQYWQTFVKWFEVNKAYLVWFGQIEARFKRWKNEKSEIHLLNEADLKEAEQFFIQVDLINQQIVRDYIIKSQRHQSKLLKIETKKQRKRTLLFSLLALIAMGSSFVAWQQKRVAEEQAKISLQFAEQIYDTVRVQGSNLKLDHQSLTMLEEEIKKLENWVGIFDKNEYPEFKNKKQHLNALLNIYKVAARIDSDQYTSKEIEALLIQAKKILMNLVSSDKNNYEYKENLIWVSQKYGWLLYERMEQDDKAYSIWQQALELVNKLLITHPDSFWVKSQNAEIFHHFGRYYSRNQKEDEAFNYFYKSIDIKESLVKSQPELLGLRNSLSDTYRHFSFFYRERASVNTKESDRCEYYRKALQYSNKALDILKTLINEDPLNLNFMYSHAKTLANIAALEIEFDKPDSALQNLKKAESEIKKVILRSPDNLPYLLLQYYIQMRLGDVMQKQNELKKAQQYYYKTSTDVNAKLKKHPEYIFLQQMYWDSQIKLHNLAKKKQ